MGLEQVWLFEKLIKRFKMKPVQTFITVIFLLLIFMAACFFGVGYLPEKGRQLASNTKVTKAVETQKYNKMPEDNKALSVSTKQQFNIKLYIAYTCFILVSLMFCWIIFKYFKDNLQKRKFEKDKNTGWYINQKTGKTICSICWDKPRFTRVKSFLRKDVTGLFMTCPRCKTMYELPPEMLSKEDFMENSDIKTTNKRPRKKAMRVSTLKRSKLRMSHLMILIMLK